MGPAAVAGPDPRLTRSAAALDHDRDNRRTGPTARAVGNVVANQHRPYLREQAIRTLYWFGRRDPATLFTLALESLEINDQYISQGTLAATYGVVLAHQRNATDLATLSSLLTGLRDALLGPAATRPTDDWLIRLYVRGIIHFAYQFRPDDVPDGILRADEAVFGVPAAVEPLPADDPRSDEVGAALHLDFENYTIGSLIEGRANYDRGHPRYLQLLADIRGTLWALGWREATFGPIDEKKIENLTNIPRTAGTGNTERYGKKYSWIASTPRPGARSQWRAFPGSGTHLRPAGRSVVPRPSPAVAHRGAGLGAGHPVPRRGLGGQWHRRPSPGIDRDPSAWRARRPVDRRRWAS